jgi:archaellum biogenesis protein FlaJ (TadC family)
MESRLTTLEGFVRDYAEDINWRLRRLEKESADKFLERIANILTFRESVPEIHDRFKLAELSESVHEATRKAAMELREEIDRRLRA